jgi:glucan phosphorylase
VQQRKLVLRKYYDYYVILNPDSVFIIVPMFYGRRDEWIKMMKGSIGKIAYYFNSHRVVQRFVTEAYL